MTRKLKTALIAAGVVAAAAGGGAAIAGATGDDDATEKPITGSALEKAKAAALANTPGRVTGTEVGDEEGYYEVEVTTDGGGQVDVHLDRGFNVLSAPADGDSEDGPGDD
jgi:uncharacterized membrane protein YkoI